MSDVSINVNIATAVMLLLEKKVDNSRVTFLTPSHVETILSGDEKMETEKFLCFAER